MQKNEEKLFNYLLGKSGLNGGEATSHLAKLVLFADMDKKTLTDKDALKYKGVPIPNLNEDRLIYLPIKKQSLNKKFRFGVAEILKKQELGYDILQRINEDREYSKNPNAQLGYEIIENGVRVRKNVTRTDIRSFLSEVKNELLESISLRDKCEKILLAKSGSKTYNLTQVILTKVNHTFLESILSEVEIIVRNKINNDVLNLSKYFYEKRTRFLTRGEIFQTEGEKIAKEFKYTKNTVEFGFVPVYPVDYEKLSKLTVGLVAKWLSKSEPSSAASKGERAARMTGRSSEEILSEIRRYFGLNVDDDMLADAVREKLLSNSPGLHDDGEMPLLSVNYDGLKRNFIKWGGDQRLVPSSHTASLEISQRSILDAIETIKSHGLSNQRLLFGMFKLLSDNATLTSGDPSARKKLSLELEVALIKSYDMHGKPMLLHINDKSIDNSESIPAIILSKDAYKLIDNVELKEKFRQFYGDVSGLVQKGALSIGALIKTEKGGQDIHKNPDVQHAIDLISYIAELYKWYSNEDIFQMKDKVAQEKKAVKKEETKQKKLLATGSPDKRRGSPDKRHGSPVPVTTPIQQVKSHSNSFASLNSPLKQERYNAFVADEPFEAPEAEIYPLKKHAYDHAESVHSSVHSLSSNNGQRSASPLASPLRKGQSTFGKASPLPFEQGSVKSENSFAEDSFAEQ